MIWKTLLFHYNICLIQLPLLVVLVHETDKHLAKAFLKKSNYEDIISRMEVDEDQGYTNPLLDVQWMLEYGLCFLGESLMNITWILILT